MLPPSEGQVIAGKYRLERPLSRGGMGSVWVARHLDLGMPVAVKLMDPLTAARPAWRQRFAREAKAAGAIQSPHVVKVHDYGVDGETPYLVMELLHGEDLGVRLRREGRLTLESTARLVLAIAKGLKRAHEAGVVHRDLKPANVFLARVDDDELVQILDFGIAKLTRRDGEGDRTETGVVMGSIHYMSPEQARGFRDADHRADIWSLGVITYRALTGELPFPGEESGDVLVKVCTDPVPAASTRLRSLDGRLAREIDRFFARALAKNPAERFQAARDLADTLCSLAGLDVDTAATTTRTSAMVLNTGAGEEPPTRTEAIAALAAPVSKPPTPVQTPDLTDPGTSAISGAAGASITTPGRAPPAAAAPPRSRAAWVAAILVAAGSLAALLTALSRPGGGDPPSSAPVTAAGPVSALPAVTAPAPTAPAASATAMNTASSVPPVASTTAPLPPASASASAPSRTPSSAPPRPASKPEDRVKAKFGF